MSTAIEQLYIFEGFSESEIAYFLLMSQTHMYKKWEILMKEGDPSNGCAYFIKSWHAKVMTGIDEIALLGPGDFFGEVALITDESRNATIETIDNLEVHVFLKEDFLVLLKRSKHSDKIKAEILSRMKDRVQK